MGPLLYLNEPDKYTVSLGLKMFIDQDSVADYGGMVAMSLVALLPVLAFFVAFQRYLIDGMATSGSEGLTAVATKARARAARRPRLMNRFALFAECLLTGVWIAVAALPLVTFPPAFAAGARHLRRLPRQEHGGLARVRRRRPDRRPRRMAGRRCRVGRGGSLLRRPRGRPGRGCPAGRSSARVGVARA